MIGVSVVSYRSSPAALRLTLAAVSASTGVDVRVRLHANAGTAADAEALRAIAMDAGLTTGAVDVTWSADNLGFAEAHNRCLAALFAAGATGVVVLNPDLALAPDAIATLAACVDELGPVILAGPLLELADPATLEATGLVDTAGIRWTWDGRHLDRGQGGPIAGFDSLEPQPVDGISGACLFVSREAHEAVVDATGEFFDASFIAYREDAELAHRASLLGIPSVLFPAARGRHARRLRGTARGSDPQIDLLGVRNRFLIAFKYGVRRPGGRIGPWLRDLVVILAVAVAERSSLPGLHEAWTLRDATRAKGEQVRSACRPPAAARRPRTRPATTASAGVPPPSTWPR